MNAQLKYSPVKKKSIAIDLPYSKSVLNRRLVIQGLLGNFDYRPDKDTPNDVLVMSNLISAKEGEVDVMDAGTAMRFGLA